MLTIRLQRTGAKNQPDFRLVVAEKHRSAKKLALEILGQYNPRTKELRLKSEERLKLWIGRNIELSPTVRNLLITKKLLEGAKVKSWRPKPKPAQVAAGQKSETPAETAPAAAPVAETPAETVSTVTPAAETPAEEKPTS
ncbi:MAG: 30S ribosomal protein S16 [Candidatus Doudnabacteria bacterium]|nr:30S ribosomal protein S16 [Candidatus Doudnabacteria bacterium]